MRKCSVSDCRRLCSGPHAECQNHRPKYVSPYTPTLEQRQEQQRRRRERRKREALSAGVAWEGL